MADVNIDNTVSTSTARGMRGAVFTTADIGYWFYIDTSTSGFKYSKTTNGGANWGAGVLISPAVAGIAFDVWFDQWTPGDSGTLIHTWAFEATADDVVWRTLDTNGDTLGTARNVFVGLSAVAGRGAFVSGTKTRSGYLYCAYDIDAGAEKGLHRSTDGGTNWSANLATTFVEATLDEAQLFPASNTGDNNDCWAIYKDTSALAMTLKMWDSSAGSATESATIQTIVNTTQATDLTGQFGYSASVRHSDGHLILASISNRDTATSDHSVWDINGTASITAKTAITTNIDDHWHPSVFIDQTTDDIYVAYNGKRDGSETLATTTNVYYTKSTDGGTTWSAGDTAYRQAAAGVLVQTWAPLMGPRFYVGWRVSTALGGNNVNSVTFGAAGVTVTPGIVALVLATFAAVVTATANVTVTPSTKALTLATFAPTVTASNHKIVTPSTASLATSTFAPTVSVSDNKTVTPTTAALVTATFAPTVTATANQVVTPTTATLTTATFAPTVTASDHKSVTPNTATLTTATFAPVVTASDHKVVTPTTAALTIATFAPTVTASEDSGVTVTPSTAALTTETFAPSVSVTDNQLVTPSTVALSTSTFAPTVTATANQTVTPSTAALSLTTFAPTVTATKPIAFAMRIAGGRIRA